MNPWTEPNGWLPVGFNFPLDQAGSKLSMGTSRTPSGHVAQAQAEAALLVDEAADCEGRRKPRVSKFAFPTEGRTQKTSRLPLSTGLAEAWGTCGLHFAQERQNKNNSWLGKLGGSHGLSFNRQKRQQLSSGAAGSSPSSHGRRRWGLASIPIRPGRTSRWKRPPQETNLMLTLSNNNIPH